MTRRSAFCLTASSTAIQCSCTLCIGILRANAGYGRITFYRALAMRCAHTQNPIILPAKISRKSSILQIWMAPMLPTSTLWKTLPLNTRSIRQKRLQRVLLKPSLLEMVKSGKIWTSYAAAINCRVSLIGYSICPAISIMYCTISSTAPTLKKKPMPTLLPCSRITFFSPCGSVSPFPRFPLWAICRSAKAYRCRCVFAGRQSLCTLTKNARKITAAQYKRQTNTYYLYRAKRRVRHDRFSP